MWHGTWRPCWLWSSRKADQSGKSGWRAGRQTAHGASSCLSAASHLPLTIWIPQGTDQKAHAGLSLFCSKKNLLTRKGKNWEVWPPPSANTPKMKPRASFPNHSCHSRDGLRTSPPTTSTSQILLSLPAACQKNRG